MSEPAAKQQKTENPNAELSKMLLGFYYIFKILLKSS
jgi:hypothetical protein